MLIGCAAPSGRLDRLRRLQRQLRRWGLRLGVERFDMPRFNADRYAWRREERERCIGWQLAWMSVLLGGVRMYERTKRSHM